MRRVVVHIDKLLLKGFRPEDRLGISDGLRSELARLLAAPGEGTLASLPDTPRIVIGRIAAGRDASHRTTGIAAAQAIAKELQR